MEGLSVPPPPRTCLKNASHGQGRGKAAARARATPGTAARYAGLDFSSGPSSHVECGSRLSLPKSPAAFPAGAHGRPAGGPSPADSKLRKREEGAAGRERGMAPLGDRDRGGMGRSRCWGRDR